MSLNEIHASNNNSKQKNPKEKIDIENPFLKIVQKKIFLALPKSNYRYSAGNKSIMTGYTSNQQIEPILAPTIMHEQVFHTGRYSIHVFLVALLLVVCILLSIFFCPYACLAGPYEE